MLVAVSMCCASGMAHRTREVCTLSDCRDARNKYLCKSALSVDETAVLTEKQQEIPRRRSGHIQAVEHDHEQEHEHD